MTVETKTVDLYTDMTTYKVVDVYNAVGSIAITSNSCQSVGGPASASIIAGPGHDVVEVLIGDTTGSCAFSIGDQSGNNIEIVVNNNGTYVAPTTDCADPKNVALPACMPAAPAPTIDCADPKNMSLPQCMKASAPAAPAVTMDLA